MFRRRQGSGADSPAGAPPAGTAAPERIGTRFTMKQRLFALGDDFHVTDEQGQRVFHIDGKMFRVRDTLVFNDAHGTELYKITGKLVDIRETMVIKRANGQAAATVHNAWVSPVRDRWKIDVAGGEDMTAVGSILQHEYTISQGRNQTVAVISKKWLRVADTYGVEVSPGADAALILAISVVIDMMSHNQPGSG